MIFLIVFSFSSCAQERSVREMISTMSTADPTAPAGKIYLSEAVMGENEYISRSLRLAFFGVQDDKLEGIDSYAIRLSLVTSPYEYAVVKAKNIDDTEEIAKLLCARIDNARSLAAREKNEEYLHITSSAQIYVRGKYVLLLMTNNNESILDAAKKVID